MKLRDYIWLDYQPLAQIEYAQTGTGPEYTYFTHVDHLGTPRALTADDGTVVWATRQRPSGELVEAILPDARSGQPVVTNLRLPGQYDERLLGSVGLQGPYYNWNRWYLPGLGRYLEPDPIALGGGFNGEFGVDWYGYANQNPMRYTDPWGLDTYVCTAPLHAFGGTGKRSGPDAWGNPFYHKYLCINKTKCGGQDRSGNSKWYEVGSPGKKSQDSFNKDTCEKVAPDNQCLELCIAREIDNPKRPWYSVGPFGEDCQEWADEKLDMCRAECKGK
ncbi:MAG: RHS repeat-associated core domain-containing protein [Anaeromyxobacter sp.]